MNWLLVTKKRHNQYVGLVVPEFTPLECHNKPE